MPAAAGMVDAHPHRIADQLDQHTCPFSAGIASSEHGDGALWKEDARPTALLHGPLQRQKELHGVRTEPVPGGNADQGHRPFVDHGLAGRQRGSLQPQGHGEMGDEGIRADHGHFVQPGERVEQDGGKFPPGIPVAQRT